MATDTAHIKLELASGRNEDTAPFHQTAARRRNKAGEQPGEAAPPDLPANAQVLIDVPLGNVQAQNVSMADPKIFAPPRFRFRTWIALVAAGVALVAVVWWAITQRAPESDLHATIERNLGEARTAMAEGRYTDPPERSALRYYNAVLAIDPNNADAVAGIDAIADRHLTDARVLLSEQRVAEAGVAIEKARRIRPDHSSLLALDMQLRIELKKILAAANAALLAEPVKAKTAKVTDASPPRREPVSAPRVPPPQPSPAKAPIQMAMQTPMQTPSVATAPPESGIPAAASASAPKDPPRLALAQSILEQKSPSPITPVTTEPDAMESGAAGSAPIVEEAPPVAADPPRLIKMVEPEYPKEALLRGLEGWVEVSMEVNAAGDVIAPRIEGTSRGRLFNRAALTAVQQWKYEPRNGDTSERLRVRVQFRQSQ